MKNLLVYGTAAALGATLTVGAAPAMAQTAPTNTASAAVTPQNDPKGFQPCAAYPDLPVPQALSLGEQHGPGATERVTDQLRSLVDRNTTDGHKLPAEAYALRYLDTGRILVLDRAGKILGSGDVAFAHTKNSPEGPQLMDATDEVKRIVKACLGVGSVNGMSFEQLVRWLGNPKTAAKFVIRRIGWVGAVSCIGGVIFEYI